MFQRSRFQSRRKKRRTFWRSKWLWLNFHSKDSTSPSRRTEHELRQPTARIYELSKFASEGLINIEILHYPVLFWVLGSCGPSSERVRQTGSILTTPTPWMTSTECLTCITMDHYTHWGRSLTLHIHPPLRLLINSCLNQNWQQFLRRW